MSAAGKTEEGTRTICANGQDHPDSAAPGVTATSTIDARTLQVVARKDGRVVGRGTYEVSDDSRTMTVTMSGNDASGRTIRSGDRVRPALELIFIATRGIRVLALPRNPTS